MKSSLSEKVWGLLLSIVNVLTDNSVNISSFEGTIYCGINLGFVPPVFFPLMSFPLHECIPRLVGYYSGETAWQSRKLLCRGLPCMALKAQPYYASFLREKREMCALRKQGVGRIAPIIEQRWKSAGPLNRMVYTSLVQCSREVSMRAIFLNLLKANECFSG